MRILLLNSGGLDSALLAHKAHAEGHELYSLFLDFGTENAEQVRVAARETASRFADYHAEVVIDYGFIPNHTENGVFKGVPATSKITLALGQGYAKMAGCDIVWAGFRVHVSDLWANLWNQLDELNIHNVSRVPVSLPVWDIFTYEELAEYVGANLDDFTYTVSCRESAPCGTCEKCIARVPLGL